MFPDFTSDPNYFLKACLFGVAISLFFLLILFLYWVSTKKGAEERARIENIARKYDTVNRAILDGNILEESFQIWLGGIIIRGHSDDKHSSFQWILDQQKDCFTMTMTSKKWTATRKEFNKYFNIITEADLDRLIATLPKTP